MDWSRVITKLEKMAAGTKVIVYKDDQPVEFDSLAEAAAFITQQGAIPLSKVEKMLSQRQNEINGLRIEYPVVEESASGAENEVQELAAAFKGLTGAYGSSSYGTSSYGGVKMAASMPIAPVLLGAGGGAIAGALSSRKHRLRNAIIGALVGGGGGTLVGKQMQLSRTRGELEHLKADRDEQKRKADAGGRFLRDLYDDVGLSYPEGKRITDEQRRDAVRQHIRDELGDVVDTTALVYGRDGKPIPDESLESIKSIRKRLHPNQVAALDPILRAAVNNDTVRISRPGGFDF